MDKNEWLLEEEKNRSVDKIIDHLEEYYCEEGNSEFWNKIIVTLRGQEHKIKSLEILNKNNREDSFNECIEHLKNIAEERQAFAEDFKGTKNIFKHLDSAKAAQTTRDNIEAIKSLLEVR